MKTIKNMASMTTFSTVFKGNMAQAKARRLPAPINIVFRPIIRSCFKNILEIRNMATASTVILIVQTRATPTSPKAPTTHQTATRYRGKFHQVQLGGQIRPARALNV